MCITTWRSTISTINRSVFIVFFLAGLLVTILAGLPERSPGYMDAEYYYAGGLRIAQGNGLSQSFLWNFLDDPQGLPHPAFSYWMPLTSILAGLGAALGGDFVTARLPFMLLSALIPVVTVLFGLRLHGDPRKAILGGVFALFPVFYAAYMPTTDSFPVYMLLGSGILWLAVSENRQPSRLVLLGLLAGLMHLTRADGVIWFAGVLVWVSWNGLVKQKLPVWKRFAEIGPALLWTLLGYLLAMSGWFVRNLIVWGGIFPPGGSRTLWLTRYEDTFLYPASQLTPARWLESGWQSILSARWTALGDNLQTAVAVQGSIVLFVFILVGLWRLRRLPAVRFGLMMWVITVGLMTVVFPFAGTNGAFFHSGAAFQILFWASAPLGIEAAVNWLSALRHWTKGASVRRYLEGILVAVCVLLTLGIYFQRVVGNQPGDLAWNMDMAQVKTIESRLVELGAREDQIIMVNNPPAYDAFAGRKGVVIPFGDKETLKTAARRYQVSFLILDENNSGYLGNLYTQPGDVAGMRYLGSIHTVRVYAFTNP